MVVEEVTDPKKEISLAELRKESRGGGRHGDCGAEAHGCTRAHRGTDAKQVILQKVREAERDTIFNEYHTRVASWSR